MVLRTLDLCHKQCIQSLKRAAAKNLAPLAGHVPPGLYILEVRSQSLSKTQPANDTGAGGGGTSSSSERMFPRQGSQGIPL